MNLITNPFSPMIESAYRYMANKMRKIVEFLFVFSMHCILFALSLMFLFKDLPYSGAFLGSLYLCICVIEFLFILSKHFDLLVSIQYFFTLESLERLGTQILRIACITILYTNEQIQETTLIIRSILLFVVILPFVYRLCVFVYSNQNLNDIYIYIHGTHLLDPIYLVRDIFQMMRYAIADSYEYDFITTLSETAKIVDFKDIFSLNSTTIFAPIIHSGKFNNNDEISGYIFRAFKKELQRFINFAFIDNENISVGTNQIEEIISLESLDQAAIKVPLSSFFTIPEYMLNNQRMIKFMARCIILNEIEIDKNEDYYSACLTNLRHIKNSDLDRIVQKICAQYSESEDKLGDFLKSKLVRHFTGYYSKLYNENNIWKYHTHLTKKAEMKHKFFLNILTRNKLQLVGEDSYSINNSYTREDHYSFVPSEKSFINLIDLTVLMCVSDMYSELSLSLSMIKSHRTLNIIYELISAGEVSLGLCERQKYINLLTTKKVIEENDDIKIGNTKKNIYETLHTIPSAIIPISLGSDKNRIKTIIEVINDNMGECIFEKLIKNEPIITRNNLNMLCNNIDNSLGDIIIEIIRDDPSKETFQNLITFCTEQREKMNQLGALAHKIIKANLPNDFKDIYQEGNNILSENDKNQFRGRLNEIIDALNSRFNYSNRDEFKFALMMFAYILIQPISLRQFEVGDNSVSYDQYRNSSINDFTDRQKSIMGNVRIKCKKSNLCPICSSTINQSIIVQNFYKTLQQTVSGVTNISMQNLDIFKESKMIHSYIANKRIAYSEVSDSIYNGVSDEIESSISKLIFINGICKPYMLLNDFRKFGPDIFIDKPLNGAHEIMFEGKKVKDKWMEDPNKREYISQIRSYENFDEGSSHLVYRELATIYHSVNNNLIDNSFNFTENNEANFYSFEKTLIDNILNNNHRHLQLSFKQIYSYGRVIKYGFEGRDRAATLDKVFNFLNFFGRYYLRMYVQGAQADSRDQIYCNTDSFVNTDSTILYLFESTNEEFDKEYSEKQLYNYLAKQLLDVKWFGSLIKINNRQLQAEISRLSEADAINLIYEKVRNDAKIQIAEYIQKFYKSNLDVNFKIKLINALNNIANYYRHRYIEIFFKIVIKNNLQDLNYKDYLVNLDFQSRFEGDVNKQSFIKYLFYKDPCRFVFKNTKQVIRCKRDGSLHSNWSSEEIYTRSKYGYLIYGYREAPYEYKNISNIDKSLLSSQL